MELIKKVEQKTEVKCYSPRTIKTYKYHIQRFIEKYKLEQENIESHLYDLKKKGYSPESLNLVRASLIYFFKKVLNQEIKVKIETPIRRKALPRPEDRYIIQKIMDIIKNQKHRLLVEFTYSSGLRPSEVINVRWDDIDFNQKIVRVNHGKGNKDRYSILSKKVIYSLLKYKKERVNQKSTYVFDSMVRPSTHITLKTFQKVLINASKKAKLGKIVSPYNLRHSFASHSLEEGIDIRYIQDMLGHNSPKTTMRYTLVTKHNLSKLRSPLDNIEEGIKRELGSFNQPK